VEELNKIVRRRTRNDIEAEIRMCEQKYCLESSSRHIGRKPEVTLVTGFVVQHERYDPKHIDREIA